MVDWAPRDGLDRILFVFDGGALGPDRQAAIRLPPDELASWAFLRVDELGGRLAPRLLRRVTAAVDAQAAGATRYLEHGVPVG